MAPDTTPRRWFAIAWSCAIVVAGAYFGPMMEPWQRLAIGSVGLLYLVKTAVLLTQVTQKEIKSFSLIGILIYMTFWPGIDPTPWRSRTKTDEDGRRFARGLIGFLTGISAVAALSVFLPAVGTEAAGWLGIAALIISVHFGYAEMLPSIVRLCRWNVGPLFNAPLRSSSLNDFWSKRWNLAFVEMDRILFLPFLKSKFNIAIAVFFIFVLSGLLHEIAISYPSMAGWGLPLSYFVIQGFAVAAERKYFRAENPLKRIWTWLVLLLPLPLLFHSGFRETLIVPLFTWLHQLITSHDLRWYLNIALYLAALGNFCTLGAGLQAPKVLKWEEDLSKMSRFNYKIFKNYAIYTGGMIVSWGFLTLAIHDELLRGDRAALCISVVIGIFWAARILVDFFYFGSEDWPPGPQFVIGHACLTTLFFCLTVVYFGVVFIHSFGLLPAN
jgi:hypothetical protein